MYGDNLKTVAGKSYTITNNGTINIKNTGSVGIYSNNAVVSAVGTINLDNDDI